MKWNLHKYCINGIDAYTCTKSVRPLYSVHIMFFVLNIFIILHRNVIRRAQYLHCIDLKAWREGGVSRRCWVWLRSARISSYRYIAVVDGRSWAVSLNRWLGVFGFKPKAKGERGQRKDVKKRFSVSTWQKPPSYPRSRGKKVVDGAKVSLLCWKLKTSEH